MKLDQFKKRMVQEAMIFGAVLVTLGVGSYLFDMMSDDYTQSNANAKTQLDKIQQDFDDLQQKYNYVIKNTDLYKEVSKRYGEGSLVIGRQVMFEKFNQFRNQFDLSNLRLTVSPAQEAKNVGPKHQYATSDYSEVNVDLDVLYDENIYQLLSFMQRELSGVCLLSHVSMEMQKPFDDTVIKTIVQRGTYPLIKTNIKFNWYSITPVESADANNAKK